VTAAWSVRAGPSTWPVSLSWPELPKHLVHGTIRVTMPRRHLDQLVQVDTEPGIPGRGGSSLTSAAAKYIDNTATPTMAAAGNSYEGRVARCKLKVHQRRGGPPIPPQAKSNNYVLRPHRANRDNRDTQLANSSWMRTPRINVVFLGRCYFWQKLHPDVAGWHVYYNV